MPTTTFLALIIGLTSVALSLFTAVPNEVQFVKEEVRGNTDTIQFSADQMKSKASQAETFANVSLRSGMAVVGSCISAKFEVLVTELIACPKSPNCPAARAAHAKGDQVCGQQLQKFTQSGQAFSQLNSLAGKQIAAMVLSEAESILSGEGKDATVTRDDPTASGPLLKRNTTAISGEQAVQLARKLPIIEAPFTSGMLQSFAPGFAKGIAPSVMQKLLSQKGPKPRLRGVPHLEEGARADCAELKRQMDCQVAYANGDVEGCSNVERSRSRDDSNNDDDVGILGRNGSRAARAPCSERQVVLSKEVEPYATCERGTSSSATSSRSASRAVSADAGGTSCQRWKCEFDKKKECVDKKIEDRSEAFMDENSGLAKHGLPPGMGTVGANAEDQRSCTSVEQPWSEELKTHYRQYLTFTTFFRRRGSSVFDAPAASTSCGVNYGRFGRGGTCEGIDEDHEHVSPTCFTGISLAYGK